MQQQLRAAKILKDRKMRHESLKFGVICGLTIPIQGLDNDYAELSLRLFKDETCLNQWQHNKYEWPMRRAVIALVPLTLLRVIIIFK